MTKQTKQEELPKLNLNWEQEQRFTRTLEFLFDSSRGEKQVFLEELARVWIESLAQAQQEAREEERKEIFRIISEELHDTQPDPYKGWVDYINMDVDDFLDELEKALQKESK